jgi:hypothetical protein
VEEDSDQTGSTNGLWSLGRQADAASLQFPPEVEVVLGDEQLTYPVQVATTEPVVAPPDPRGQVLVVVVVVGRLILDDVDAEGSQQKPPEASFERADIAAGAEQTAGLARAITVVVTVTMPVARVLTMAGRPPLVITRLFHGTTAFLGESAPYRSGRRVAHTRSILLSQR